MTQTAQPKAYSSLGKFFVVPLLFGLGVALLTGAWICLEEGDSSGVYSFLILGNFSLWGSWRVLRARS